MERRASSGPPSAPRRRLVPIAEADPAEVRRALRDAGFKAWVEERQIVRMEIGAGE